MLKPIQATSGLVFAVFVGLHLVNTWAAALGAGSYDGLQALFRQIYQFAPVEALVLAALMVHVITGLMRIFTEEKRTLTTRARWHRYAGFFLLAVIGGHILAVRGASWFYGVYPGFEGLAFSIDAVPGYFYPYYFLLAVAGFYHGLNGAGIAVARLGWSRPMGSAYLGRSTAAAALLTVLALAGFGGLMFDVGDVWKSEFAVLATGIAGEVFGVSLAP
jgi:succinate dehydrogenase/fumarate reductase cytochrome b subunit